jgi:hypothetical protein
VNAGQRAWAWAWAAVAVARFRTGAGGRDVSPRLSRNGAPPAAPAAEGARPSGKPGQGEVNEVISVPHCVPSAVKQAVPPSAFASVKVLAKVCGAWPFTLTVTT